MNFITDYQPLSHEGSSYVKPSTSSSYISTTLPRFHTSPLYESPNQVEPPLQPSLNNPFTSTGYYTLQPVNRTSTQRNFNTNDDLNVAKVNIDTNELYATPNKLRTTRQGFDNYFSPIASNPATSPPPFQTSTPTNGGVKSPTRGLADEIRNRLRLTESGARSSGNSPINSGRSTPRLEPQARTRHSWASQNTEVPQTCADRMKPKTSLMDFKRLLLEHGKTNPAAPKKSAVEQLKLNKNQPLSPQKPIASKPLILDLSGSPKTFATRRMIRQGNFGLNSPVKSGPSVPKHVSPRTGWRYNNIRTTDVITTAIPEVNSEESDSSPNNSIRKLQQTAEQKSPGVVEEKVNMRDNIFLKTEENNFMKHEMKPQQSSLLTRAQLQAQRAQFLLGNNNNNNNNNNNINSLNKPFVSKFNDSKKSEANNATPSLETAL